MWDIFPCGSALASQTGLPGTNCFLPVCAKRTSNVWMQTFKTAVFDELTLFGKGTTMWYVAYLLMVLFAVLLVVELVLFAYALVKRPCGMSGLSADSWACTQWYW